MKQYVALKKPYLIMAQDGGISDVTAKEADWEEISRFGNLNMIALANRLPLFGWSIPADFLFVSDIVPISRRVMWMHARNPVATNMVGDPSARVGFTVNPTSTGTESLVDEATGAYRNFLSGAAVNNRSDVDGTAAINIQSQWTNGVCIIKMKTGANATDIDSNTRTWVGLFESSPIGSNNPVIELAGFRYSPAAGDTGWMACTNDSSLAVNATATGVAVTADKLYLFKIVLTASSIRFFINGVKVATVATQLPSSTVNIGCYCGVINLTVVARNIRVGKFYLDFL